MDTNTIEEKIYSALNVNTEEKFRKIRISHYRYCRIGCGKTNEPKLLPKPAIKALRDQGFTVTILPSGGLTVASARGNDKKSYHGASLCNIGDGDNFKYDEGRKRALNILLANISKKKVV